MRLILTVVAVLATSLPAVAAGAGCPAAIFGVASYSTVGISGLSWNRTCMYDQQVSGLSTQCACPPAVTALQQNPWCANFNAPFSWNWPVAAPTTQFVYVPQRPNSHGVCQPVWAFAQPPILIGDKRRSLGEVDHQSAPQPMHRSAPQTSVQAPHPAMPVERAAPHFAPQAFSAPVHAAPPSRP